MDAQTPTRTVKIKCAPRKAPCPKCRTRGRRNRIRYRNVRSLSFKEILWLEIEYGEYTAKCDCCVSFHSCPEGVDPKAKYDHKVRQAVIDRILQDKLNLSAVQASMQREFLLELSTGYVYAALDYAISHFNGNEFREQVLAEFSGTLCVDEIHLGRRVVLIASDPISDNPIACALVSRNDADHMERFLRNLKNHGFSPKTVITDRSPLYPTTIQTVWPEAQHQLCVFHVIADVNKLVLDAVRETRRGLAPKRAKKGKRGRPKKSQQSRARKRQEKKRRADLLFRNRYLIVRKQCSLSDSERTTLDELLSFSGALKTLRAFTKDLHALFSLRRTEQTAWSIWRRMRRNRTYLKIPALKRALGILTKQTMTKLLYYLQEPYPRRSKVRTNNHVERCNRKIRYLEKVRYKWRRSKTIVRHMLLQFQHWIETKQIADPNQLQAEG
jgi:transposase-like protein